MQSKYQVANASAFNLTNVPQRVKNKWVAIYSAVHGDGAKEEYLIRVPS